MNKTKFKVERVFNNDTKDTFEELLVKAINTNIANRENVFFDKKAVQFSENNLKCI